MGYCVKGNKRNTWVVQKRLKGHLSLRKERQTEKKKEKKRKKEKRKKEKGKEKRKKTMFFRTYWKGGFISRSWVLYKSKLVKKRPVLKEINKNIEKEHHFWKYQNAILFNIWALII